MKTTLDIEDRLLSEAKAEAARQRVSLTHLIEQGIRLRLRRRHPAVPVPTSRIPVYKGKGGSRPGLDARSNRSLNDAADP